MAENDAERLVPPTEAVLREEMSFEGLLLLPGPARIDGHIRGEILAGGPVWIGVSGRVEADLEVEQAVIAGRVHGAVTARRRIELLPTAVVEGDPSAPRLALAEGARVDGRCRLGPERTRSTD
jgi:cytoskeletal protein CcmA (bactofilin family)